MTGESLGFEYITWDERDGLANELRLRRSDCLKPSCLTMIEGERRQRTDRLIVSLVDADHKPAPTIEKGLGVFARERETVDTAVT